MTMQSMNTAPGRNSFQAAGKPAKVSLPVHKSTVTAASAPQGNAHTAGKAVKGFSGTGVIKGKV